MAKEDVDCPKHNAANQMIGACVMKANKRWASASLGKTRET